MDHVEKKRAYFEWGVPGSLMLRGRGRANSGLCEGGRGSHTLVKTPKKMSEEELALHSGRKKEEGLRPGF